MSFSELPNKWDEAIPLGNGVLGVLLYQKDSLLRFSLDRVDLWDLRQTDYLKGDNHTFSFLYELWKNGNYQRARYLRDSLRVDSYPSKIPVAAIDFKNIEKFGPIKNAALSLNDALCHIKWDSGTSLETFVAADNAYGWFRFENLEDILDFTITPPNYDGSQKMKQTDDKGRNELITLGYPEPEINSHDNAIVYKQKMVEGEGYTVYVYWKRDGKQLTGVWSVVNNDLVLNDPDMPSKLKHLLEMDKSYLLKPHRRWWDEFWGKSSISVPDSIIQSQYIRDKYKFGATTGIASIPVSLQAIWTADNGKMPPWSGNFTNDLNTQESYWGAFNGNHLEQAKVYTEWLWKAKPNAEAYTQKFFEVKGLAFPGISTIEGGSMVAWWPYAHNPTIAAWLGQNFYWYWRYSLDKEFLRDRAYPWLKETTVFFDNFSILDAGGKRRLPLSSSPEINDDRADAWFAQTTNHDLALILWTYEKAIELGQLLGKEQDVAHLKKQLAQWPKLALSSTEGILIAPDYSLAESHRHLGHLMAIYPLGTLDVSQGEEAKTIIGNSLDHLDKLGTKEWVGWAFPWYSLLRARDRNGEKALEYLRIFAESFCGPNSFHLNGDQSGKGYSNFTYRPFTLEGNFGFIGAVQEMLLQSHTENIVLFPAIPDHWKEVAFKDLRAEGAFTVSAKMANGQVRQVAIRSHKGGILRLVNPFEGTCTVWVNGKEIGKYTATDTVIEMDTNQNDEIQLWQNP